MKNNFLIRILFCLLFVVSQTVLADDYMGADKIKDLISGKTIYAKHLKRNFTFKVFFDVDGETALRTDFGKTKKTKYEFKGNKHCIYWKGKNRCANILDNGDGTYTRVNKKGKKMIMWTKIIEGKE